MKKIYCDFCLNEVSEDNLFLLRNTGDSLNVVLDSFDDWENSESDFDVCKGCIKKIGKKFFNKMADKYCEMEEEEEFIQEVWDKKLKLMIGEIRQRVLDVISQKSEVKG